MRYIDHSGLRRGKKGSRASKGCKVNLQGDEKKCRFLNFEVHSPLLSEDHLDSYGERTFRAEGALSAKP